MLWARTLFSMISSIAMEFFNEAREQALFIEGSFDDLLL